jgi:ankyrin repeat protein
MSTRGITTTGFPLHLASYEGNLEAAQSLFECGTNVLVRDNEGQTPLHRALQQGHHNITRLLLEHGVGVDVQGNNTTWHHTKGASRPYS